MDSIDFGYSMKNIPTHKHLQFKNKKVSAANSGYEGI